MKRARRPPETADQNLAVLRCSCGNLTHVFCHENRRLQCIRHTIERLAKELLVLTPSQRTPLLSAYGPSCIPTASPSMKPASPHVLA